MFTVIIQNKNPTPQRFNVAVGDVKTLINLLVILDASNDVNAYKVVDGDAGVLKDLKGYGFGHLDKMVEQFSWNELKA